MGTLAERVCFQYEVGTALRTWQRQGLVVGQSPRSNFGETTRKVISRLGLPATIFVERRSQPVEFANDRSLFWFRDFCGVMISHDIFSGDRLTFCRLEYVTPDYETSSRTNHKVIILSSPSQAETCSPSSVKSRYCRYHQSSHGLELVEPVIRSVG